MWKTYAVDYYVWYIFSRPQLNNFSRDTRPFKHIKNVSFINFRHQIVLAVNRFEMFLHLA